MKLSRRIKVAVVVGFWVVAWAARAQEGVTPSAILLGQSGEHSGQAVAKENMEGATVYFDQLNRRGGVHGRRLELRIYDDGRDVQRGIANTEKLIAQDKVFALMGYRSTPSVEAAIPIATREKVPLIAPFSGAETIRTPQSPVVFHLRASYRQEAMRLVQQLATQGVGKIAVFYQDDAFGKDALAGFEQALAQARISPLAVATYDRKSLDVKQAVATLVGARADAIVMACSPKACVDFVKQVRARGSRAQFLTLSNVNSDEFVKALGQDGRGVVVAQVIPNPWHAMVPLAQEFRQALKDSGAQVPVSYSSFEGFIAAKLVALALRNAGPAPTRAKFIAALQAMGDMDLGGFRVHFSPGQHQGSSFVDLSMISSDGRYIR